MHSIVASAIPSLWQRMWLSLAGVFSYLHLAFIRGPLETLYLYGPRVLGCWEGKPVEDICTHLAPRTRAEFWLDHPDECMDLVDKNIYSWILLAEYLIILVCLWWVIRSLSRWWWHRRLLDDLHHLIQAAAASAKGNSNLKELQDHKLT